jgi:hypothetical protein
VVIERHAHVAAHVEAKPRLRLLAARSIAVEKRDHGSDLVRHAFVEVTQQVLRYQRPEAVAASVARNERHKGFSSEDEVRAGVKLQPQGDLHVVLEGFGFAFDP